MDEEYDCYEGCATCGGPDADACSSCLDGSMPVDDDMDGFGTCTGGDDGDSGKFLLMSAPFFVVAIYRSSFMTILFMYRSMLRRVPIGWTLR